MELEEAIKVIVEQDKEFEAIELLTKKAREKSRKTSFRLGFALSSLDVIKKLHAKEDDKFSQEIESLCDTEKMFERYKLNRWPWT